jgi:hypothetical protein
MGTGIEEFALLEGGADIGAGALGLGEGLGAAGGIGATEGALGAGALGTVGGALETAGGALGTAGGVLGSSIAPAAFGASSLGLIPGAGEFINGLGTFNGLADAATASGLGVEGNALGQAYSGAAGLNAGQGITSLTNTLSNAAQNLFTPSGVTGLNNINTLGNITPLGEYQSPFTQLANGNITSSLSNIPLDTAGNAMTGGLNQFVDRSVTTPFSISPSLSQVQGLGTFESPISELMGKGVGLTGAGESSLLDTLKNAGSRIYDLGTDAVKSMFTKIDPVTKQSVLDKQALITALVFGGTYFQAKQKANQLGIPFDYNTYVQSKVSPIQQKYAAQAPLSAFVRNPQPSATMATGGRVYHASGNMVTGQNQTKFNPAQFDQWKQRMYAMQDQDQKGQGQNRQQWMQNMQAMHGKLPNIQMAANGGRMGLEAGGSTNPQAPNHRPAQLIQSYHDAKAKGDNDAADIAASDLWKEFSFNINPLPSKKNGGRIHKNIGGTLGKPELYTPTQDSMMDKNVPQEGLMSIKLTPTKKKKGGQIIQHPVRLLEGGMPELDLRAAGGYVPMGKKERADDVPAMLSKNEFVFTADAVRNAGGGDVNKGAQKMYKLMKSLEGKKVKRREANA